MNLLDIPPVEAGAFHHVMDRGYGDFERPYAMHQTGAFFVTRAKKGMDARRADSAPTDRARGVICDQRNVFNGFHLAKNQPEHLRRKKWAAGRWSGSSSGMRADSGVKIVLAKLLA